jgi:hypothetical protein
LAKNRRKIQVVAFTLIEILFAFDELGRKEREGN